MDTDRALRERLIDVGVELVLAEGTSGVGLREIARRAGVSHGAPRRYFPTHRALLSAIARRGFAELGARIAADTADAADTAAPRARLAVLARVYVGYALERRGMFELMFRHDLLDSGHEPGGTGGPQLREATLPMFGQLVELVAQCRSGPGEPPAAVTAAALWSNLHGVAQLWAWGSLQLSLGDCGSGGLDELIEAALQAHLGPADA